MMFVCVLATLVVAAFAGDTEDEAIGIQTGPVYSDRFSYLAEMFNTTNFMKNDTEKRSAVQPNFLFLLVDDLGYNDVGYVNSEVISPNIDELATTGVILDKNYVAFACTPSRHAIMTSMYPFKSGMQHGVLAEENPHCSPINQKMMPQRFKDLGYSTHMIGKWHLGFCREECLPTRRGFDTFYGMWTGAQDFYYHTIGGGYDWRDQEEVDESARGQYHTTLVTERAKKVLTEQDPDTPWFMYMSYANVHTPLQVPERYFNMYEGYTGPLKRKAYFAMMTAMDESIGEIVALLKSNGMYDNTVIVLTSDNGGEAGGQADNTPLRSGKASLWEGGNRVVGFVHSPLLQKTGYHHDGMIHATDWAPTFISMAGGSMTGTDGLDQTDMIVNGGPSVRDEIVLNIDLERGPVMGQAAIIKGDYKLIYGHEGFVVGRGLNLKMFFQDPELLASVGMKRSMNDHQMSSRAAPAFTVADMQAMQAIMTKNCFRPGDRSTGIVHLFNLADDPGEYNDLAEDPNFADKLDEMFTLLESKYVDYVKVPSTKDEKRHESEPDNFGGNWSTGWCMDVAMTI